MLIVTLIAVQIVVTLTLVGIFTRKRSSFDPERIRQYYQQLAQRTRAGPSTL
jgi:hypothetical protein